MKLIDIILEYRCNSRCRFCAIEPHLRSLSMSTAKAREIILESGRNNCTNFNFGGGEPTCRKDLPLLIALAKQTGADVVSIQTNGFMLAYPKYVKKLILSGMTKINVSIRGHTKELQDWHTRTPNSFDYLIKGLQNLLALNGRLIIELDVILTKQVLEVLPSLLKYYIDMGFKRFNLYYVSREGAVLGNEDLLLPRYSDIAPVVKEALTLQERPPVESILAYYFPDCFLEGFHAQVWRPTDEVCLVVTPQSSFQLEMGEIDFGVKTDSCEKCSYFDRCIGIRPSYLEYFGMSEIKPIVNPSLPPTSS